MDIRQILTNRLKQRQIRGETGDRRNGHVRFGCFALGFRLLGIRSTAISAADVCAVVFPFCLFFKQPRSSNQKKNRREKKKERENKYYRLNRLVTSFAEWKKLGILIPLLIFQKSSQHRRQLETVDVRCHHQLAHRHPRQVFQREQCAGRCVERHFRFFGST